MVDETFLESMPDDPLDAVLVICDEFNNYAGEMAQNERVQSFQELLTYQIILRTFIESINIELAVPFDLREKKIEAVDDISHSFAMARQAVADRREACFTTSTTERFKARFGTVFSYEFTDGDFNRLQTLINELRDEVTKSDRFEEKHRQRILAKLEKLQREIHKRMTNLDTFWGLVGDAGVAIGKFGADAKPFVDRVREVAEIVLRTQANAAGLRTGLPMPTLLKLPEPAPDDETGGDT